MKYTLSDQLIAFLCSLVCGACLGAVYEVFRFFREFSSCKKFTVAICDLLFMLIFSFVSVLFSICYSRGSTRYFTVAGEVLSFIAVRCTLGTLNVRLLIPLERKFLIKCRKFAGNMGKTLKKLLQGAGVILYNKNSKKASASLGEAKTKPKRRGKRYHGVKTAE